MTLPSSYDSWRLRGPDEDEDIEAREEARLDAEAQAYHLKEEQAMEAHFERKYPPMSNGDSLVLRWSERGDV